MHVSDAIDRIVWQRIDWKPASTWAEEDGRTGWTDSGDMDWTVVIAAQDEVRVALEDERLTAWEGEDGNYRQIPAIEWRDREPAVNFNSYGECPGCRTWVKRKEVIALWPDVDREGVAGKLNGRARATGRPRELDREWIEKRSRQILGERPAISRASLAGSLIKEMAFSLGREPDQRGVERILKKLGLPSAD